MFMYGWAPLLFTWNYHNIVNHLDSNMKLKVEKKKVAGDFPHGPVFNTLPSNEGHVS